MRVVDLIRIGRTDYATFGVIRHNSVPFALTLELPWRNNAKGQSCIPAGGYRCERVLSPKFGNTFEVKNVPMRSHILFHKGNTVEDTEGCILVGEEFDHGTIASSARGYGEFMSLMADVEEFMLIIHEV